MTPQTLSCDAVRGHLVAYVQGALSLPATQQVHAHLTRCVGCRATADGRRAAHREPTRRARSLTWPTGIGAMLGATLWLLHGFDFTTPMAAAPPAQRG